ncbi:hypothetical protein [Streptomyces sp. MUSC 125]|uniref:hypothetical protein n=1 Tax=Streptomyces sp. MUSC 125 TaxID=1428624 RepID=UPI00131CDD93|nr:hypothetical protein [Streptomyces sp. MUSC 125]
MVGATTARPIGRPRLPPAPPTARPRLLSALRRDPGIPDPPQDGRELRLALDDVLVVRATGEQLQTLGTRSQGGSVTSPFGRRFTS